MCISVRADPTCSHPQCRQEAAHPESYWRRPAAQVATTVPSDYHPSMGDLMTMAVQPRHIKLGLAGKQQNWIYAKYELSELRNAFARIVRAIPQYQSIDTAALTTAIMQAPLNALEQAIDAKSAKQFAAAYTQLT
jgi:hypothetical protein